jgi:Stage II sporulation protein E (SpoIIE)
MRPIRQPHVTGEPAPARLDRRSDPARTAAELGHSLVPQFADHVAVHLSDTLVCPRSKSSGTAGTRLVLHRVAVVNGPECTPHDVMRPGEILRLSPNCPVLNQLANGETVHYPHLDAFNADHLTDQLGGERNVSPLRNRSVLMLPLIVGDTLLGNVLLIREPERQPFETDEVAAVTALTRWAARCIDADHRYLRGPCRWIMPAIQAPLTGLEVRSCCLPQSRVESVGGDWCDVVALPGGETMLLVGDVMGHGTPTAAVMNQCRSIVRTLASLGLPPEEVLRQFDALTVRSGSDGYLATCICATYDPRARKCRVANAGHVPAVLIRPDGHGDILDTPTGMPIGIGGVTFEARSFDVADGSALALCSDGFAELHGRDLETGLLDLCALCAGSERPLGDICDELLKSLDVEDRRDDVTLLVGHLLGTG